MSTMSRAPLPDDAKQALRRLMAAIEAFRSIRVTMPLQYVHSFLLVALHEGLSLKEYAEMSGVANSVMSRHLQDIGDRNRSMEEGFGLVTYRAHPHELRKHEYFLTPVGKALAHKINRAMEG